MIAKSKKILFIAHEATLSGSSLQLLGLMQWIKSNHPEVILHLLFLNEGIIAEDFKNIADYCFSIHQKQGLISKIKSKFFHFNQIHDDYDVIFGNTIVTLDYLINIKKTQKKAKTLLHFHETVYLSQLFYSNQDDFARKLNQVEQIISVSDYVKEAIMKEYNISVDKISKIYPFLSPQLEIQRPDLGLEKGQEEYIFTAIGNPHLVKGFDLIPQIISKIVKKAPHLQFKILCVGGVENHPMIQTIKNDLKKMSLSAYFHHQPQIKNTDAVYEVTDALLMISREESFSVVTAEALKKGLPVLSFKGSGGPEELLNKNELLTSEYQNLEMYCDKIIDFTNHPEAYYRATENLRKTILNHTDYHLQCEKIFSIIYHL